MRWRDSSWGTRGRWGRGLLAAVALLGWVLLAALIASLYVGHASSPYGACYAASGRSVSCEALHHAPPRGAPLSR